LQEMDLAAARAGLDIDDPPPHVDGVIETVVGAKTPDFRPTCSSLSVLGGSPKLGSAIFHTVARWS